MPYPPKGDRWIDVKRERDNKWYNWMTGIQLVQAYGRSVRSKDDWAKTFVLDKLFTSFVKSNKLPLWFTEAIQWEMEVVMS